jgi:hypothetical protein
MENTEVMHRDERVPFIVLGRNIGTAAGWDQVGDWMMCLYHFVAVDCLSIPLGDLTVDFDGGNFEIVDDYGNVTFSADIIETLSKMPRPAE